MSIEAFGCPRPLHLVHTANLAELNWRMASMRINADYTLRVVLNHHELPWVTSPESGVERRMLDRVGDEVARATSIVRYQPGSRFRSHTHDRGEEILVLDGVFSDENGDYPAGTYLMNPPGSSHAPFSETGCTLFVKLRHLGAGTLHREVIDTRRGHWRPGLVPGLSVMPLMTQGSGSTLVRWAPNTYFNTHRHHGGEEIFVVGGVFSDEHGTYPEGSWIRSPHLSQHTPFSVEGCTIFVKTGHLATE
jgi:anti-sigma factor ChrR (cupin superfamily)